MFIEINGHLVNQDHIVQVTPQSAVELTSGSVITCGSKDQEAKLREALKPSAVKLAPAPAPGKTEAPKDGEKTK